MQKILVVSHCILNTASKVVSYHEKEMEEEKRNRKKLMEYIIENDIQLLQLPCPEFTMYGFKRWGHVKDQFEHPFFRKHCRNLLESVLLQLQEYNTNSADFEILAIVAVDGSPSCGHQLTCRGDYGGEFSFCKDLDKKLSSVVMVKESGVFMEELENMLEAENLDIPIKDLGEMVRELDL